MRDLSSFNDQRNATGGKADRESKIRQYGYFLGGTDVTHNALQQYDLMRGGYGRLFILRMPQYVDQLLPDATAKIKHLLQFANVGVDGIQGYSVEFASLTAGYAGNTIELPTNAKDDTNSITIKIYETSASLVRSYIDFWITGVCDPQTGLAHYHGAMDLNETTTPYVSQAFHTMEAIYVATDPSGQDVQYACLLANMFPKSSDHSNFTYDPGSHDLVQLSLEFTAAKYMSPQITQVGKQLIKNYAILKNYMNFKSNYSTDDKNTDWYSKNTAMTSKLNANDNSDGHLWDATQLNDYYSGDQDNTKFPKKSWERE